MEKKPTNLSADKKLRKRSDDLDKIQESAKPLRVLIVDDSQEDAVLVLRELKRCGFDPSYERVETAETMAAALQRESWDIIISDYQMPRFSGSQAIALLRQSGLDIPCLVVSGTVGEETAVTCMRVGARDYIMKDALARLAPAIERELREAQSRREKHLAQEQFQQAQKMESVGRLAGGVAHDFNNILTAIMGYASFLTSGPTANSAWREDIEEIKKAAERAASLTRQLLAFSRRQAIQLRVVDLNAEFADLEKMLRRLVGEDIEWETSFAAGLGYIKADPGQIQQVIMNLVVNARDAMPNGGRLTVKAENVEFQNPHPEDDFVIPPGSYVAIAVSDTGVGMEKNVKTHLFEPFFTTKEKGKGTGLGLAVIYGIVKQSSGHVIVDSALGKGTTFKIYFPKVEGAVGPRNGEQTTQKSQKGTETILLVDDDEAVRIMMRRVLRQHGYALLEASRGEGALKLAQAHKGKLHLLLTDMVLPDINGVELAQRIASIRPEAKVLLISGYLDRDFGNFILDEKTPFLQKPFATAALARMVREVLDAGTQPVKSAERGNT